MSPFVCLSVHLYDHLEYKKTWILNTRIKIKKSHLSIVPSLRIPITTLLYWKFVSNIKNYFPPQPKNWHNGTSHVHCQVHLLRVGWRNRFFAVLERGSSSPQAASISARSDIPSIVCFKCIVQLWCLLFNKLARLTPQTNSTWRKLRSSAFKQY